MFLLKGMFDVEHFKVENKLYLIHDSNSKTVQCLDNIC